MRITQKKGDVAVAKAISTFTALNCDVSLPITESAPYDLVVDIGNALKKVQVKFSTTGVEVGLRRIHSNSKGYVVKRHWKSSFDWLYVLTGDGQEYLVMRDLANRSTITPQTRDNIHTVFSQIKIVS